MRAASYDAAVHLHLDPVGGVAGDMFAGALLDLRPELEAPALAAVRAAGLDARVGVRLRPYDDGILSGSRFEVELPPAGNAHDHVHWSTLRERLAGSALDAAVRDRAIAIFTHLAEAEARVHGKAVDTVAFHEVGAWDSIADIVCAACLIEALGAASWSVGPLPIGSGRVPSAHGLLPVPAPATVLLLEGLPVFDDGFPGERITPTGAAILRYLAPEPALGAAPRSLGRTGYGFGTRRFEGLSNVLRVLAFDDVQAPGVRSGSVAQIRFEVDDQTPEDLALALERLRAVEGVLDVVQFAATGKRGRVLSSVQLLALPDAAERAAEACFAETTTLGVRLEHLERRVLAREHVEAGGLRVKRAARPGGATAKAEMADVAEAGNYRAREALRRAAERDALDGDGDE